MSDQNFTAEAQEDTPLYAINGVDRTIQIKGVSMPENADEFYSPLLQKVDELIGSDGDQVTITIELSYMNSMSNKQILRLLKHLEGKSFSLVVNWNYAPGDELMKVKGEELDRICDSVAFHISETA